VCRILREAIRRRLDPPADRLRPGRPRGHAPRR
jgi:hypothetical protein